MTNIAMPNHKRPCPGVNEIYNFPPLININIYSVCLICAKFLQIFFFSFTIKLCHSWIRSFSVFNPDNFFKCLKWHILSRQLHSKLKAFIVAGEGTSIYITTVCAGVRKHAKSNNLYLDFHSRNQFNSWLLFVNCFCQNMCKI